MIVRLASARSHLCQSPSFILSSRSTRLQYPTAGSSKLTKPRPPHAISAFITTFASHIGQSPIKSVSTSATPSMQVDIAADRPAGADHLVKLGEDVFLLEGEKPVKHDPEHPDVS